jgi:outer membrane immunogenic protein
LHNFLPSPSWVIGAPAQAGSRPFSWTGFYVGADVGSIQGNGDFTLAGGFPTMHPDPDDVVFGGHIGYRWQTRSNLVFGVELDLWSTSASAAAKYVCCTNEGTIDLNGGGSVRGIVGFSKTLVYATGGLSLIDIGGCTNGGPGTPCIVGSQFDDTRTGWTIGGGLAHAFTNNVIVRAEYLFADYGSETYSTPGVGGGSTAIGLQTHTVRGGVSWKFD